VRAGASAETAEHVAAALAAAEADGQAGHGVSRLPSYADQVASGKVDGQAEPLLRRVRPGAILVDARCGFAYPAIAKGLDVAAQAAPEQGVMAVAIANSHHFGVAGHHVERMAERGLVAIAFGNSPAAIPPWGGHKALFGTNPIAFACPRRSGEAPLVIDLSLSKVARGKIMVAAQKGEPIPEGWAIDAEGRAATDPKAALGGAMLPMGDAKGAALALMVESLATCFTGANVGFEASSFFAAEGPPPRVGQIFLVIAPDAFGSAGFTERVEMLCAAIGAQPGARLPGTRRLERRRRAEAEGVTIPEAMHAMLMERAGKADPDGVPTVEAPLRGEPFA
jgi:(2R)-3-sulfolactate dehydrogenase (NADP+)